MTILILLLLLLIIMIINIIMIMIMIAIIMIMIMIIHRRCETGLPRDRSIPLPDSHDVLASAALVSTCVLHGIASARRTFIAIRILVSF